ncbi:B-box zinc finger protein [Archangium lipolyticum]|uniref:B-box zinc finger protein n=1 Tax=Archangium lipolyticum TaxID=2970465 RepID=UPI00214A257B|nr:B-box zinc finger protein [Archangium lipolyticum]
MTAHEPPASTSPRCPTHQRVAVATCTRCGTFLCGECTELLGEVAYCASCAALLGPQHGPIPLRLLGVSGLVLLGMLSTLAAFFPFLPASFAIPRWVLLGVSGALGLWVPTQELRRIDRGQGPRRARPIARCTRWLAAVNLFFFLLSLAWGAWLIRAM